MSSAGTEVAAAVGLAPGLVREWFDETFPRGPTKGQIRAWQQFAARENWLLLAPTGSGKTLAAFLAIIDQLVREQHAGTLDAGVRCLYISPLRSLSYDIERNLAAPLAAIAERLNLKRSPIQIGVRTGDTSAYHRRKLRLAPPHLLITTPESLALLLAQPAWQQNLRTVEHLIVDELHALLPTKRGADLAVSLERLAAFTARDPVRIGLSATCRPAALAARFLVGPERSCCVIEDVSSRRGEALDLRVESLLGRGEAVHRGLAYRRLLRRLHEAVTGCRTTVIFANTRAFAERITHDLRQTPALDETTVAAHHSSVDAARRRAIEGALRSGNLRAVVSSTSLELGVDIGTADLAVLVGLPGSVARCLQRVGRAGHRLGAPRRGLLLAATPAELAGAVVTASAAREGQVEPTRMIEAPLDVLCQQLVGMACAGECSADEAFALLKRTGPMAALARTDFDDCLAFLAGTFGAREDDEGRGPRWTAPRLWLRDGRFGLRTRRVRRWYLRNAGTICSEETVRVLAEGFDVGTLEATYAERLLPGDRFVLDGRALAFRRLADFVVHAKPCAGEPALPRWTSDRQSLSAELANALARFREAAAEVLLLEGSRALEAWLCLQWQLGPGAASVLADLFAAQEQASEVPGAGSLLVEEAPTAEGHAYAFHAPLARAACEALGRATAARLGRRSGRDVSLAVADLGWSIELPWPARLEPEDLPALLSPEKFAADVLEGLDRGDLLARRFRRVATTGLMVLRNPDGGRARVGGLLWVSRRLYPLVQAACPDHPLLRETRREVLNDLLDTPGALAWLASSPALRFRSLEAPSPFTAAWIDPAGPEPLQFEPPEEALRRLHARLVAHST